jgi:cytochrome c2
MKTDKTNKIIADLSMIIVVLGFTVIALLGLVLFLYFRTPTDIESENQAVCGNAFKEDEQPQKALLKYRDDHRLDNGGEIFKRQCAMCHSLGNNKITAPGLEGVMERVPSENWVFNYLSNSDSLFKINDPYTLKLRNEYPEERMPTFGKLTRKDIEDVVAFIKAAPRRIMY